MQAEIQQLKNLFSQKKKVLITTHMKPDADALGSSLAWMRYLRKRGHEATVITPTDYPSFLYWMEGHDDVLVYNEDTEVDVAQRVAEADVVCCLDFNSLKRIGRMGEMVAECNATKVLIDHHLEPEAFADISISDTHAAATAVLIYDIIVGLGDKSFLDTYIGECLYAGIMTDTGAFRHPNTDRRVHLIVADIMLLNVNTSRIHRLVYDTSTEERLRFLGYSLSEKLYVLRDLYTAFIVISAEDLHRFRSQNGDTEGLVNYALSMEGIVLACMIIEREDGVKLSFRSKGEFSVNEFARKYFHGGGHMNAAGGRSDLSLKDTVKLFVDVIAEYRDQLLETYRKEKFLC